MMEMKFADAATLGGIRITADGFLVTEAFAVRTGIQLYAGAEIGIADKAVVRVYRPESEVRDPKSLASFSHAPITLNHPADNITKDNWAELAKGEVSTEATWDGNRIKLPLIVKDAATIARIESGEMRDLSAGYDCRLEIVDGVTPDGQPYDAIQREIRINHLAIVKNGRAGNTRIGDGTDHAASWGATPFNPRKDDHMADAISTRTVMVDGLSVTTTDAGAQALEKLQKDAATAKDQHDAALAAKDVELATKDAKITDLEGKVLTDAALDKLVADRADLIAKAKTIADGIVTDGKSAGDIKRATVIAKSGAAMADKSAHYIDAAFDLLADAAKADPARAALADAAGKTITTGMTAVYENRNKALNDAWKGEAK